MTVETLCGSRLFADTIERVTCAMLAARLERNQARLNHLGARVAGREMDADEDALWTKLEQDIERDTRTLQTSVEVLTGITASRIAKLLA